MLNINYVAGIFDGEGSIGIHKRHYESASRGYLYTPKLRLGMTGNGIKIVEMLQKQFGGFNHYRRYSGKNKDLLEWTLQSRKDTLSFLKKIVPLLFIKKEQGLKVIEFYEDGPSKQKDWKSNRMTDEEYNRRGNVCEQVKLLNKKCKDE